ncbi:hypothetical protein CTheo_8487 [Ceratobasidium theobromae]|uniref:Transmembrane protein n=1 Tax=Ceratobasidium theobromae TaxID=1582974 RepID=A0A5N5Q9G0_9AGAM|nr:hypothetical protein CTheo_8487 [Ceratobasidium theobromae]
MEKASIAVESEFAAMDWDVLAQHSSAPASSQKLPARNTADYLLQWAVVQADSLLSLTLPLFTMHTFGRLLSVLAFLISLGLVVQALPWPVHSGALVVRAGYNSPSGYSHPNHEGHSGHHNDDDSYNHSGYSSPSGYDGGKPSQSSDIDILTIVAGLKEQCDPAIALLAKVDTIYVVNIQVTAIVGLIKTACGSLLGVTERPCRCQDQDFPVRCRLIVAIITACSAATVKLGRRNPCQAEHP